MARIDSGDESEEVQGLLEQWLKEGKLTRKDAVSTASGMFMAGVHTTAHQSTFLMYEMAKRPEVQEKLYNEIKTVLGDRQTPTADDLAKMPYTKGCVMESFRKRSTVGNWLTRVLREDVTILGYHIPAGTSVMYKGSDKGFKDPETFLPERWARNFEGKHHPFAVLPFGFGPRDCWGKRFADLELKLLLIQMTRNFLVSTDLEDLKLAQTVVFVPDEKLPLKLVDRPN